MQMPCREINTTLKSNLRTRVQNLLSQNLPPALLTVIVGDSPEQQSYVRIKRRIADELGVQFYLWQCAGTIRQDEFISQLHLHIHRYRPNGVLIQQPLPNGFDPKLIFSQLPPALDIEGIANHIYTFPLVQAALIGLTYAYDNTQNTFCLPAQLTREIVQWLKEKRIVIGGRGATSGAPIARYFDHLQIPYSTTNSQIEDADSIYRTADIIITGVGKKILTKMNIKAGVILLNFGLRQERVGERSVLKGDYDEDDISTTASLYTGTPGGLGPIDVTCMFANVIEAAEKQVMKLQSL